MFTDTGFAFILQADRMMLCWGIPSHKLLPILMGIESHIEPYLPCAGDCTNFLHFQFAISDL